MSSPPIEHNGTGPSNSQPRIAGWRQPSIEEDSRVANSKVLVEATPETQQIYNKLRAAHERRLRQHLQLPSTSDNRSARSRSRSSRSNSPSAPPNVALSRQRSTSSAADTGAGTRHDVEPPPRGRREGPLVLGTRFHAAVMRKLSLVCEFHKQAKTKCDCFDFSDLECGWHLSQPQPRSNLPRPSTQPVPITQASPGPHSLPIPWPEVPDRPPVPVDDPTTFSLESANNLEHARPDLIALVGQYGPTVVPSYPSLPTPNMRPPSWEFNFTSAFTNQPDLRSEYTMIVGTEDRDIHGGHYWICVHEDCSCGISEYPLSCWTLQDNVGALYGHFIADHGACSEAITQYWLRCKSCSARVPVHPPNALPNGGYCSCSHVQQSLWQLLAIFHGPMSTSTGPGLFPITKSDFWDDALSTTGTHTSYNSLSSYPYNDFSAASEYYGPSYGQNGPRNVQHACVHVRGTERGQDKTGRLLLLPQCWKQKSLRLKGFARALLKATPLHTSSLQHGSQKYEPNAHDDRHQDNNANFCLGPIVFDPCFFSYTSSIGNHANHPFRCIRPAAMTVTLLAPLLFGLLLGLQASWNFVETGLSHVPWC